MCRQVNGACRYVSKTAEAPLKEMDTQGAQYPLMKEYALNDRGIPNMI